MDTIKYFLSSEHAKAYPSCTALLADLRAHFIRSESSRHFYVATAMNIWNLNVNRSGVPPPLNAGFFEYVTSHWPVVDVFEEASDVKRGIHWGYVKRGSNNSSNTIFLNKMICDALDDIEPSSPTISFDQLRYIVLVVVVHELAHAYVKHVFGSNYYTPNGVGPDNPTYHGRGESGWKVGGDFFGGLMGVIFFKEHYGILRKATDVVYRIGNIRYILTSETCWNALQSLHTDIFQAPDPSELIQALPISADRVVSWLVCPRESESDEGKAPVMTGLRIVSDGFIISGTGGDIIWSND